MNRSRPVILANMCMISDDAGNVVVQQRQKSWKGIAFPGGHIEEDESFVDSTIREVYEETGLIIRDLKLCGIKHYMVGEFLYVVFLYKTSTFSGVLRGSEEGDVFWIARDELETLSLASDFEKVLPLFERDDVSESYYVQNDDEWIHHYR